VLDGIEHLTSQLQLEHRRLHLLAVHLLLLVAPLSLIGASPSLFLLFLQSIAEMLLVVFVHVRGILGCLVAGFVLNMLGRIALDLLVMDRFEGPVCGHYLNLRQPQIVESN
jgi:hypothetical protein